MSLCGADTPGVSTPGSSPVPDAESRRWLLECEVLLEGCSALRTPHRRE